MLTYNENGIYCEVFKSASLLACMEKTAKLITTNVYMCSQNVVGFEGFHYILNCRETENISPNQKSICFAAQKRKLFTMNNLLWQQNKERKSS